MKPKSIRPLAALAFLSTIAFSQASIIEFELSPAGSSAAVGMKPANEVPAVITITGSGGAISNGITFDTATSTLSFAMGYGSAAGFTDLTGAATALHIHGPAAAGVSAPALFDLGTVHFPAALPAKGGIVFGSVVYSSTQATELLAGHIYVNIHTTANPNGEIRGQLIRVNAAPEVVGLEDATLECGPPVTYSATVSDADGEAVQAVWSLNGSVVETDDIPAGGPPSSATVTYKAKLPLGINTLSLSATDSFGSTTTVSSTITVVDTTPPVIVSTSADPKVLWPPNHKLVAMHVRAHVTDACGPTTWKIVAVGSNQNVNAGGSGSTSPDWKITGDHTVSLRAERSGKSKGDRIYTITVQATDDEGNKSALKNVKVTVPHDKGSKS